MVLLLPMFISVLLTSTQADTKILSTPDGKMGPDPCARVCSGVDKKHTVWLDSGYYPGKVNKRISMFGCEFISTPVVTVVSGGGADGYKICPSLTVADVTHSSFLLYSVSDFTKDKIVQSKCRVYWTATGFTC